MGENIGRVFEFFHDQEIIARCAFNVQKTLFYPMKQEYVPLMIIIGKIKKVLLYAG